MPNTCCQLYIQVVFAVKYRENAIPVEHIDLIEKYITGIVRERKHKLYAIGLMPDHAHLFISLQPNQAISDLVRDIKAISSKFINDNGLSVGNKPLRWQTGFGAFSYSKDAVPRVAQYVQNQQEIHANRQTFRNEYINLLDEYEVDWNPDYVFDFYDDESPE